MSEKITYGIKNVYAAKITRSSNGTVTFGEPRALVGASEIALSTVGDPVKVYADNVVYFKMGVNQGYEGNLSIYNIPDWFSQDFLGYSVDANGVLIENSDKEAADFALMFEFNTDTAKTKRTVLYNVNASRPEINSTTKEDTVDPQPFSIPITASPATDTEYVKATVTGDASDSAWASWFSSVYIPSTAAQFKVEVSVSKSGGIIPGALVVCGGRVGVTDSDAKAYFMLPSGTYDVFVSAEGFNAQTDSVVVSDAAVVKAITMTEA